MLAKFNLQTQPKIFFREKAITCLQVKLFVKYIKKVQAIACQGIDSVDLIGPLLSTQRYGKLAKYCGTSKAAINH